MRKKSKISKARSKAEECKTTSLKGFLTAVILIIITAYVTHLFTKASFKYEIRENKISEIITFQKRLVNDLWLYARSAKTIAESEFGVDFNIKPYVNEYEEFYQKLYDIGLVTTLYTDIDNLNKYNYDLFLLKQDSLLYDAYKAFELSKNNTEMSNKKRSHLVYQIFFKNKIYDRINSITENNVRKYYEELY
ncbi:MAG: hypothetical protein Kow0098_26510 [Ignavibacteriaceae bacterium]